MKNLLFALCCTAILTGQTLGQDPSKVKTNKPAADEIQLQGVVEDSNGEIRLLKGSAKIETTEMVIYADEIRYNSDTQWIYAKGHVRMEQFASGDKLNADHGEYNLGTEEGKFYEVDGTSPAKVMSSQWVLTTSNPFYFKANWAERIKDRYILHEAMVTDCKIPKPWWTFQAPIFDIVPGNHASAHKTVFRLKNVPILYLPYFYRPLGRSPRQSGFLTPNFGHSSRFGYMYGLGYYWAMNRSYDMSGVVQEFTERGPAYTYDFRGKPNATTDFNFYLYSVQDKGTVTNGSLQKQGGTEFELTAKTQILGFTGRLDYNYLSSYVFRQVFSYSFTTAISSEVYSIGYLQRHLKNDQYTINIAAVRDQLFESTTLIGQKPNQVIIQRLPSFEISGRDRKIVGGPLPLYFSFGASDSIMNRQEPLGTVTTGSPTNILNTGYSNRLDVTPRVSTAFSFKDFYLTPSITFGATSYGNSYSTNSTTYSCIPSLASSCTNPVPTNNVAMANASLFRRYADFTLGFALPTIERIYTPPKWLHLGERVKHVLEVKADYEYVTGVDQFQRIVHYDATDIVSNTNQLTLAVTNRLYRKDKKGNVNEILSWRLAQARYFDPTFGGAVLPGQRNVVMATEELTPYTFLSGPRSYSPVVSTLTITPYNFLSFDWRAEYDPFQHKVIDNTLNASANYQKYFVRVGETALTTDSILIPAANQISFSGGMGNTNRRGWNAALLVDYDLNQGKRLYDFLQGSYNTNCCGFSVQLRQFNLGIRNDNQYLFSFSVANLGNFGSMQRQDRIF